MFWRLAGKRAGQAFFSAVLPGKASAIAALAPAAPESAAVPETHGSWTLEEVLRILAGKLAMCFHTCHGSVAALFMTTFPVAGLAADVMGTAVEPDQALMEAGLDSLAAVELRNAVVARFGAAMPATLALDYPTLEAVAAHIVATAAQPASKPAAPLPSGTFDRDSMLGVLRDICNSVMAAEIPDDQPFMEVGGFALLSLPPACKNQGPSFHFTACRVAWIPWAPWSSETPLPASSASACPRRWCLTTPRLLRLLRMWAPCWNSGTPPSKCSSSTALLNCAYYLRRNAAWAAPLWKLPA